MRLTVTADAKEEQMPADTRSYPRFLLATTIAIAGVAVPVASVHAQPQPTPRPVEPAAPDIAEAIEVTDAEAALRIQQLLYEELAVTTLTARVNDGVATLGGTVKTDDDRRRAAAIARRAEGVRRVINELDVDATASDDPPLASSAATLETAVAAELQRDPLLGSRDIRVSADRRSNTVTLIGEVASQAERERATRVAEDAFEAGHVRNRLQIRQDL
jgi:osmotically-inducible protein OsmY